MKEDNDGLRCGARIIEVLDDHEKNVADNPVLLKKFKYLVGEDKFEEILSYNKVMHHIEKDDDDGGDLLEIQTDLWTRRPFEQEPLIMERRQIQCQG
jgi:hypothetical protein